MVLCPLCGLQIHQDLCPHHAVATGYDWHKSNKIWCDLFHRGVEIQRLPEADRDMNDAVWS